VKTLTKLMYDLPHDKKEAPPPKKMYVLLRGTEAPGPPRAPRGSASRAQGEGIDYATPPNSRRKAKFYPDASEKRAKLVGAETRS
jgi:hypothetical protein